MAFSKIERRLMDKKTFHIVSLGCAKNTVDSDSMAQLLARRGYRSVSDPRRAHVLIVNTCGFIGPAKEESFKVLAEMSVKKKDGQVLIAAGCLTQRYGVDVLRQVPGIDGILGTRRWTDIADVADGLLEAGRAGPECRMPAAAAVVMDAPGVSRVSVQGPSAYLKIADGCRRPCAFCAIPLIKGSAVSRSVESVLADARYLRDRGVREIVLLAQDTTDYGHDLGLKNGLARLLTGIAEAVPEVDWLRVMYAYPGCVTDELIEVMATRKQVVPYLDVPLQHAHPATLRRMERPTDTDRVRRTMEKIRRSIPGLALRTTFIVGYPGETEEEFRTLLDFVSEVRFDKLGVFKFSFEPGTASEPLGDPVPDEVKEERLKRLMETQQQISLERNRAFVGRDLDVLIEGAGQGISIGRSYRDAPEIDGLVLVKGEIPAGRLVPVHIEGASVYDLSGRPVAGE
jgi:ribosomal protein S12 methylthiotransferase